VTRAVLAVDELEAGYEAGVPIVRGVSLKIGAGEIIAILGPNGAGKSTLIKAIAGIVPKFNGRVSLRGADITKVKAHELARQGLGFVPQMNNVFTLMTVADNLRLAADILPAAERPANIDAAHALFPDLARQQQLEAGRLSGGQRQMLAIARALIGRPHVLILDEATAGLSPKLVNELLAKLAEIRRSGVAIVLVEQNTRAALSAADSACILSEGVIVHQGPSMDIARDASISRLFFDVNPPRRAT